jgi:hypothetical protein
VELSCAGVFDGHPGRAERVAGAILRPALAPDDRSRSTSSTDRVARRVRPRRLRPRRRGLPARRDRQRARRRAVAAAPRARAAAPRRAARCSGPGVELLARGRRRVGAALSARRRRARPVGGRRVESWPRPPGSLQRIRGASGRARRPRSSRSTTSPRPSRTTS